MKIILFIFLALFSISFSVKGQDTIITVNGEILTGKIIEIGIKYVEFNRPSGLNASLPLLEVFMIKYANGTKEVFPGHLDTEIEAIGKSSTTDLYFKGKEDVEKYYSGTTPFCLGGISPVCLPILPIVILAYSSSNPNPSPKIVSDPTLMKNPDYMKGYKDQYRLKSVKKAALGSIIGTGAIFATYMTLIFVAATL
ncbi:MAG: hypothetical protein H0V01_11280 [Bacteroidetes bacterium]|nr:hypothetical protein [Bacteroidota bacterium]HET6243348.1 hypothetical protein [Bacteroidia bacterium]